MVIDDLADSRDILAELLRAWGYRSIPCGQPQIAPTLAAAEPPMAFIIDIGLPGIDGYQLSASLKKDHPDALFIANSGWPRRPEREAELGFKFDQYLMKPAGLMQIKDLLDVGTARRQPL